MITSHQNQEDFPGINTSIIWVFDFTLFFDFTLYALRDHRESLSFLNPYVFINFDVIPNQLSELFCISTPVSESILQERVHCDCFIFVNHKSTTANSIELDMVYFDVILGTN